MNRLPDIGQVSDLRLGDHPGFDAWFYSFCAENNIEHGINPSGVASPEQLRFMVAMDERQVYAPCSDATFRELAASFHLRSFPPRVRSQYIAAWRSIIRVVRYEKDRQKRRDMINYCRHRFRGCLALGNILPSRLVKRLVTTLISHFDAGDPWLNERLFYNETLASFLRSQTLQKALGRLPDGLSADVCVLKKPIDRMYLAATSAMALIDAVEAGTIDGQIVLVLANASKAFALERAKKHGIPAEFVSKKQAGSDEAFNDIILQKLKAADADLVVLAGYLPILGRQVVRAYEHRIINIHPALIPAFCGPGMYGHHVHEAVLAYGAKISGATTHFVDEQVDHGGVIMQKSVPVLEGDTPETLAARVLTVEHEILPESVRLFCAEKLGVDGRQVHVL